MYLQFIAEEDMYEIENLPEVVGYNKIILSDNVVNTLPQEISTGFIIVDDYGEVLADFEGFNAIFSRDNENNQIIFTNKENISSVYYLYDDNGYVFSYIVTQANDCEHSQSYLVRQGYTADCFDIKEDEIYDENMMPKFRIVNDTLVENNSENKQEYLNNQIQLVKRLKIQQLSDECQKKITEGIDYNGEHFSYTPTDQSNILNLAQIATTTKLSVPYHADGCSCRMYSKEDVMAIYSLQEGNVTHYTTYYNQLKLYVESLNTIEEINSVNFGDELTGVYLDTYNEIMTNAQFVINAFLS